ncbi:F-box/WD repeat-containing protein 9 isoform X1 [Pleuronectes platessa]|uniref:F-box/WD repeat-containing protein 9 isoform X1 n=2 Tax=Pleuronectes platessa TaxID=8262 RepID=UPI00232A403E|nr:F-box/WD repeat-containing protein 9 isoform X1 [Pleuronectes platessa]XP_053296360.1 F-box/WD repeat-containing protein 9 isoform X1 [Pleuronectes platessa]
MSDVRGNLCEPCPPDPVGPPSDEAPGPDLQSPQPAGQPSSADASPSPCAEKNGLLSLPWEMVTHIASYLPAQCVTTVLPKVCQTLGNLEKDSSAWQLRARRLIGSQAGFPVGPREDFDWPTACLEMEQLIICWKGRAQLLPGQAQPEEEESNEVRQQQQAGQDRQPGEEGQDGGREAEVEGAGGALQEAAYGAGEEMEVVIKDGDGEMQPIEGADQLARLREDLNERVENIVALNEEEMDPRMMFDANGEDGALNHQENLADPGNLGGGRQGEMEQSQPCRSPSPPPALERITIPTNHIASVNSVLLVGGEGKVCATASRDWNVKLWDLQAGSTGTLLHTLGGQDALHTHRGWVWCLASQGSLLASGCFDSSVRLWDLQAGGAVRGLIRTDSAVLCLSYQTDVLLAGTMNKTIIMWDTRAASPVVKSLCLHGNGVMCLAADDQYIISGGKDHNVYVYDRRAGKVLKKLRLTSYLRSLSYSGSEVWAGDSKGMLRSFSTQAGTFQDKDLFKFDVGHTAMITGVHRSHGSLYTCSSDRTVKVHIPCAPPRTLCTLHHQVGVSGLSVDAGVFAVATGDVCVDVWRPRK